METTLEPAVEVDKNGPVAENSEAIRRLFGVDKGTGFGAKTPPEEIKKKVRAVIATGMKAAELNLEKATKDRPNQMHLTEEKEIARYERALEIIDGQRKNTGQLTEIIGEIVKEQEWEAELEWRKYLMGGGFTPTEGGTQMVQEQYGLGGRRVEGMHRREDRKAQAGKVERYVKDHVEEWARKS